MWVEALLSNIFPLHASGTKPSSYKKSSSLHERCRSKWWMGGSSFQAYALISVTNDLAFKTKTKRHHAEIINQRTISPADTAHDMEADRCMSVSRLIACCFRGDDTLAIPQLVGVYCIGLSAISSFVDLINLIISELEGGARRGEHHVPVPVPAEAERAACHVSDSDYAPKNSSSPIHVESRGEVNQPFLPCVRARGNIGLLGKKNMGTIA
jgi:hypothetical protein